MGNSRFTILICLLLVAAAGFLSAQSDFDSVHDLYENGRRAQDSERYYSAIESYKAALEVSPFYLPPMLGLAESYFSLGEYEEALSWCEKAAIYDRTNLYLQTVKGRTMIGLGRYDEAEQILRGVLDREPYNFDAQFGLAELDIALGRDLRAQGWYQTALSMNPRNRRALLSLSLIYNSRKDLKSAEDLIKIALHYYPSHYMTQYLAGELYYQLDDVERAEMHTKKALALRPGFEDAVVLLTTLYLNTSRYDLAESVIRNRLETNRDNHILWYSLGIAQREQGLVTESINSFAQAFRRRTDDEVSRIALEDVVMAGLDMDSPERNVYADYHFEQGRVFQHRNYYEQAADEYRRGLAIDPFSIEGRLLYAAIFKAFGYHDRYLSELKIIESEGEAGSRTLDEIEIYESLLDNTVADRWNIRQYPDPLSNDTPGAAPPLLLDQSGNDYSFLLFYEPEKSAVIHPMAEKTLADYFSFHVSAEERIGLREDPAPFIDFSDAFSRSRNSDTDFFIILTFEEQERYFRAVADIYSGKTGGKLDSITVLRTGNDKIKNTMRKLAGYMNDLLPLKGTLLDKRFDSGLINIGRVNGVEPDMEFAILRSGSMELSTQAIEMLYDQDDVLGRFIAGETDELVTEGTLESDLFFDLINPGDDVLLLPAEDPEAQPGAGEDAPAVDEEEQEMEPPVRYNLELYNRILKIR